MRTLVRGKEQVFLVLVEIPMAAATNLVAGGSPVAFFGQGWALWSRSVLGVLLAEKSRILLVVGGFPLERRRGAVAPVGAGAGDRQPWMRPVAQSSLVAVGCPTASRSTHGWHFRWRAAPIRPVMTSPGRLGPQGGEPWVSGPGLRGP